MAKVMTHVCSWFGSVLCHNYSKIFTGEGKPHPRPNPVSIYNISLHKQVQFNNGYSGIWSNRTQVNLYQVKTSGCTIG